MWAPVLKGLELLGFPRPRWSAHGAAEEARAPSRRALGAIMEDLGFYSKNSQS